MPAGFLIRPSLEPVLEAVRAPREGDAPYRHTLRISALAIDLSQTLGLVRPIER